MRKAITFSMTTDDGQFNEKVRSIKGLRALLGIGLKEAKELAEEIQEKKTLTQVVDFTDDEEKIRQGLEWCTAGGIGIRDNSLEIRQTILDKMKDLAVEALGHEQYDLARSLIQILETN